MSTLSKQVHIWLSPQALANADTLQEQADCRTRSEFIEKAIQFYSGYLTSQNNEDYLPTIVLSTLKSIVRESDNRQNRNLYKIAVELDMLMNVIATLKGFSDVNMQKLRGKCEHEVKCLNGIIRTEEAVGCQES